MKKKFYQFSIFTCAASAIFLLNLAFPIQVKGESDRSLSVSQKTEVQEIIAKYLQDNPELIIKSIQDMRTLEKSKGEQRSKQNLITYKDIIFNDPDSPVGGNPNGDVTIVEFFDYNCGYCKKVFPSLEKLIAEDKNLRFVFKEFPILSPQSELAARAALAAWRQNKAKYMQIHSEFIRLKGNFSESRIMRVAMKLKLNPARLKRDMVSASMNKIITGNRKLAQKLGISGTPAVIINNKIIPGAVDFSTLKQLIADARKD